MRVPTYSPAPTVQPIGGSIPFSNVQASPDAFGAPQARAGAFVADRMSQDATRNGAAVQNLSEVIQKVGTSLGQIGLDEQTRINDAAVNDAYAKQFAPQVADITSKYKQLQGEDAINGYKPALDSLTELRDSQLAQATNPDQRKMIDGMMAKHVLGEITGMADHLQSARTKYQQVTSDAFVSTKLGEASRNFDRPGLRNDAIEDAVSDALRNAIDRGVRDPVLLNAKAEEIRGTGISSVVEQMMLDPKSGPIAAKAFLDASSGAIDPKIALKLQERIKPHVDRALAGNVVDQVVGRAPSAQGFEDALIKAESGGRPDVVTPAKLADGTTNYYHGLYQIGPSELRA
ncbi:MAG: hypothetical protein WCF85_11635 [Rhodospirillaceae bacterium]